MKKEINYLDLKTGDRLSIMNGRDLEVIVDVTNKQHCGNLLIWKREARGSMTKQLAVNQYMHIAKQVAIFNYGYRHYGKRAHVRLEMPNTYEYILNRSPIMRRCGAGR